MGDELKRLRCVTGDMDSSKRFCMVYIVRFSAHNSLDLLLIQRIA